MLSQVSGQSCRDYAAQRSTLAAARRELEDLRAAINHYHHEGLVREKIKVVLPEKSASRERWLTRQEAAQLVRSAWRYLEVQQYRATDRRTRRHVAKFVLVALYTGRRAGAITEASFYRMPGRGFLDVDRGVFYPRAGFSKTNKKRQPTIPIPRRLLAHMRRWKRMGQRYVVEWNGAPIGRMAKAFRSTVKDVGLGRDVTPHVLRHTAATWGMQRSADPWKLSEYLGMSLETLLRVYGHHHPDHMKGGYDVFDKPGGVVKDRHRRATGKRGRKGNKRPRTQPKRRVRSRSR